MAQAPQCVRRIESVEEYLAAVDAAFGAICGLPAGSSCELWFRGQAQIGFHLTPSIARGGRSPALEVVYLSKFKSLSIPYVQTSPAFPLPGGAPPYWSWLFLMQHYGVPTRLLDWSRDALTALFFATDPADPARTRGIDAAVWVLNPVRLNTAFAFYPFLQPGYIPNVEELAFNRHFGPGREDPATDKPAAAIGPLNSTRIVAQRGVFTVFPQAPSLTPLDQFDDSADYLQKICVAWESFDLIHTRLQHYGITRLTLFPEIEQVAGEIALQVQQEGILDTG